MSEPHMKTVQNQRPEFDYDDLEEVVYFYVQERAERIHNLARMTATSIVQIGQYLTEVKETLGHGRFLGWIELEFAWKQATAYRFMQVYENVKVTNLINLEIDVSALYLIAAPKTPEPVRGEALRRAGSGEAVTHQGIRALVDQFAKTGEIPDVKVSLAQLIEERRSRLDSTRIETKVPTPAEIHAMKQEEAQVQSNMDHVKSVFDVIDSIEHLCGTRFTARELAAELTRLDTPDKNWCGQARQARGVLTELCEELGL